MKTNIALRLSGAAAGILFFASVAAARTLPFSMDFKDLGDIALEVTKPMIQDPGVMPIPEPSSLLLLGTGVAGLLARRLKRRNERSNSTNT